MGVRELVPAENSAMEQLLIIFSFIIILCSMITILSFNPIHSIIWLVLTFISSSLLIISLGYDFIGLIVIIVYVGAIAILFLFVIMMLDILQLKKITPTNHLFLLIFFLGVISIVQLWFLSIESKENFNPNYLLNEWKFDFNQHLFSFSVLLYNKFYNIIIIISLILLIGMVGVILLSLDWSILTKRQNLSKQHHRNNSWV